MYPNTLSIRLIIRHFDIDLTLATSDDTNHMIIMQWTVVIEHPHLAGEPMFQGIATL